MKTILCTLLAVLLCATPEFAADKPKSTTNAPASSLVEIGQSYNFVLPNESSIICKVIKRINDNWIQVQVGKGPGISLLNLQTVIQIYPNPTFDQSKP